MFWVLKRIVSHCDGSFEYPQHIVLMGAQKNRLIETVLLSTHNICFDWGIAKIIFKYTLLSGGLHHRFIEVKYFLNFIDWSFRVIFFRAEIKTLPNISKFKAQFHRDDIPTNTPYTPYPVKKLDKYSLVFFCFRHFNVITIISIFQVSLRENRNIGPDKEIL